MTPLATQVEELPDNRVRLEVEVPGSEVHHAVEHAASDLAGSLRIPGFRKGKVPMPVLMARVGRDRIYTEAVRHALGHRPAGFKIIFLRLGKAVPVVL